MFVSHPLIVEKALEERSYQEALVAKALEKNTLVVAPTALGKTVVALRAAAHYLWTIPHKKILILAPTRPLAAQHQKSFQKFLKVDEGDVVLLTGNVPPEKRPRIWREASIICATPHVILNDLKGGRYVPGDLSLVVFDEAHRAVGDYPYPELAEIIQSRILGLTASPGGEAEAIKEVCKNLHIEGVEIRDESDRDVTPYVKGFEIEWHRIDLPEHYWVIRNLLHELLKKRLGILKEQGFLKIRGNNVTKKELLAVLGELQKKIRVDHRKDLYLALSAVSGSLTIVHAMDLLETQGLHPLALYLGRTEKKGLSRKASKALKSLIFSREFKRALAMSESLSRKYPEPKIEELKKVIKGLEKDSKVIVFTQYRDSASEIVRSLNEIEGVRAVRFVGQTSKVGDKGLSQKEQIDILNAFRDGDYNLLVATSVAEEGLDVPAVDMVIFFEPVPSEIRMIQRRGRTGRTKLGRVVVLIARKTRDEGVYWSSVAKERSMKKNLGLFKKGFIQRDLK